MDEYRKNLLNIIEHIRSIFPLVCIILITPPPVDEEVWLKNCLERGIDIKSSNRRTEVTRKYADAVVSIAKELNSKNILNLDLYSLMFQMENWKSLLSDGLHLNAAGNQLVFDSLIALLERNKVDLLPSSLSLEVPDHKEIDLSNLSLSLLSSFKSTSKQE